MLGRRSALTPPLEKSCRKEPLGVVTVKQNDDKKPAVVIKRQAVQNNNDSEKGAHKNILPNSTVCELGHYVNQSRQ